VVVDYPIFVFNKLKIVLKISSSVLENGNGRANYPDLFHKYKCGINF
jgi:hypothetical protein